MEYPEDKGCHQVINLIITLPLCVCKTLTIQNNSMSKLQKKKLKSLWLLLFFQQNPSQNDLVYIMLNLRVVTLFYC